MRPFSHRTFFSAVLLSGALILPAAAYAQPRPQQQQAPAAAPAKPYKPVAVTLAAPVTDPTFEAFRKQIADAAQKKDRAALEKLVVAQGFFWDTETGDKADAKKSGIENLSAAIGLTGQDANGWDALAGYASDPSASPAPDHQGALCSPADPTFDDKALEELTKATQTDASEWGYPMTSGVEVHATAQAKSPVTEKLGMHFVRVLPDSGQAAPSEEMMMRIVTPSGKTGFISADAIAPLGNDQICFIKDAGGWKIAGFSGGATP